MKKIPVLIVDSQVMFTDALAHFLSGNDAFSLRGVYPTSAALFEFLNCEKFTERAVCILETALPDSHGLDIHNMLTKKFPCISTIFLSANDSPFMVREAWRRQAASFLSKRCAIDELVEAIKHAYYLKHYLSDNVLKALDWNDENRWLITRNTNNTQRLSKRERQILTLICQQMNSHEIAGKLYISLRTVENHRQKLLLKTGTHNLVGLVMHAVKNSFYFPN